VANEGLEKARAYLNQVPRTDGFTFPPKDAVYTSGENTFRPHLLTFLGRAE